MFETARQRDKGQKGLETTHNLLCPLVLENEKGRKGTRVRKVRKGKNKSPRQRPPFMPFYDVLCPLVLENEKGHKGHKG